MDGTVRISLFSVCLKTKQSKTSLLNTVSMGTAEIEAHIVVVFAVAVAVGVGEDLIIATAEKNPTTKNHALNISFPI